MTHKGWRVVKPQLNQKFNHINGDWDERVFHWWFVRQVVWIPVKLNVEKPLVVL